MIGAILVVVDSAPRVDHAVRWRDVEYETLRAIHAGYDQALITERLGPATVTDSLKDGEYRQRIYIRREH